MQFARYQLVKFAAKTVAAPAKNNAVAPAAGPTNSDLYSGIGRSYAERIDALNPRTVPLSDRSYLASSEEGRQLAANRKIDISPETLKRMAVERQQRYDISSGKVAPAVAKAAPAPAAEKLQSAKLKIETNPNKMDAASRRAYRENTARNAAREKALAAQQPAKVAPGAPSTAPAPSAPPPAPPGATFPEQQPIDTSKPVVF